MAAGVTATQRVTMTLPCFCDAIEFDSREAACDMAPLARGAASHHLISRAFAADDATDEFLAATTDTEIFLMAI